MSLSPPFGRTVIGALALTLSLAACQKSGSEDAAGKPGDLAANVADPALTGALQDQIMVDPDLVDQSGAGGAAQRGNSRQAPVPDVLAGGGPGRTPAGALRAPAPKAAAATGEVTLGELADKQGGRGCVREVRYSAAWAAKLPAAIPLYPDARVLEAAGNELPGCDLRVVSFASAAPKQRLIDWYYTQAVRSGYSAEHQASGGEHVLAGTRAADGGAYYLLFNDRPGGGTNVDLVATNGR